jgi:hypothetical protein
MGLNSVHSPCGYEKAFDQKTVPVAVRSHIVLVGENAAFARERRAMRPDGLRG